MQTQDRVFAILSAFDAEHPARTLTELAEATGLPMSTTHRFAAGLVKWGALERDSAGHYTPGLRMFELGARAPRIRRIDDVAHPTLGDVAIATHGPSWIAVPDAGALLVVETSTSKGDRVTPHRRGKRLTHPGSAELWVLRAFGTLTSSDEDACEVRRDGYAAGPDPVDDASFTIAAPVIGRAGMLRAVLAVTFPDRLRDLGPNTSHVVRAAARISARVRDLDAYDVPDRRASSQQSPAQCLLVLRRGGRRMTATNPDAEPLPLDLAGPLFGSAVVICPADVRSRATR